MSAAIERVLLAGCPRQAYWARRLRAGRELEAWGAAQLAGATWGLLEEEEGRLDDALGLRGVRAPGSGYVEEAGGLWCIERWSGRRIRVEVFGSGSSDAALAGGAMVCQRRGELGGAGWGIVWVRGEGVVRVLWRARGAAWWSAELTRRWDVAARGALPPGVEPSRCEGCPFGALCLG